MCDSAHASRSIETSPRPRWTILYGATSLVIAAGAAVEAFVSAGVFHALLQAFVAGSALAVMAIWVRRNRVSLDLEDWCDCARDKITIRVVSSRGVSPHPRLPDILEVEELEDEPAATVTVTL